MEEQRRHLLYSEQGAFDLICRLSASTLSLITPIVKHAAAQAIAHAHSTCSLLAGAPRLL
eukprot:5069-Heterococcus_DN1.PRE.2